MRARRQAKWRCGGGVTVICKYRWDEVVHKYVEHELPLVYLYPVIV